MQNPAERAAKYRRTSTMKLLKNDKNNPPSNASEAKLTGSVVESDSCSTDLAEYWKSSESLRPETNNFIQTISLRNQGLGAHHDSPASSPARPVHTADWQRNASWRWRRWPAEPAPWRCEPTTSESCGKKRIFSQQLHHISQKVKRPKNCLRNNLLGVDVADSRVTKCLCVPLCQRQNVWTPVCIWYTSHQSHQRQSVAQTRRKTRT